MANTVFLKRSAVPGKVPSTSDLALGEIATNTYDGNIFFKKSVSGTETIVSVATLTGSQTLTNKTLSSPVITGTLTADGSVGTSGQVLASTGSGVKWVAAGSGSGGSTNSFGTIGVSGQSNIVASVPNETLNISVSGFLGVKTDANSKTLTVSTNTAFPFTTAAGSSITIPLMIQAGALSSSLSTVYMPFVKSDGTSNTTLKLT